MNQICNCLKSVILRQARPALALSQRIILPYSTSTSQRQENKKQTAAVKVTLLSDGDKMEVITLDQAKKIAEKRNLKLVNIVDKDTKSSRAIYKLMTSHEYHAEELKRREEKKEHKSQLQIKPEKLLTIGNKISQHDLESKIVKIKKWVEKLHEIRVVVTGEEGNMAGAEKTFSMLEEGAKEVGARTLQKRIKDNTIRFTIMPDIKKEKEKASTGPHKKELLEPDNLNIQQARSYSL